MEWDWVDEDKILIKHVETHELIYNRKNKLFKDKNARRNAWLSIGAVINKSAEDSEQRWTILRKKFATELRKSKSQSAAGAPTLSYWSLLDNMMFLEKHILPRRRQPYVKQQRISPFESDHTMSEITHENLSSPSTKLCEYTGETLLQDPVLHLLTPPTVKHGSESNTSRESILSSSTSTEVTTEPKIQMHHTSICEDAMFSKKIQNKLDIPVETPEDLFGKMIGLELSKINDNYTRIKTKINIMQCILDAHVNSAA